MVMNETIFFELAFHHSLLFYECFRLFGQLCYISLASSAPFSSHQQHGWHREV
jgi:hypothetical protein